jgi:hypothetical protein
VILNVDLIGTRRTELEICPVGRYRLGVLTQALAHVLTYEREITEVIEKRRQKRDPV